MTDGNTSGQRRHSSVEIPSTITENIKRHDFPRSLNSNNGVSDTTPEGDNGSVMYPAKRHLNLTPMFDVRNRSIERFPSYNTSSKSTKKDPGSQVSGKTSRSFSDAKLRVIDESKVMVLGMAGVGKSALVVRFITNRFIWEYDPTLESTYKHVSSVDDQTAVFEILDTAGQEDCTQRQGSVRWADGFLLIYAINDRESFRQITQVKKYLTNVKQTNFQCVLVANKSDLLHERKVEFKEGQALAQSMSCQFFEVSASDGGSEVTDTFHELHREIKRTKTNGLKLRRRSSAQQVLNVFNRVLSKIGNTS